MTDGTLVSIEGLDGCGKSTLIEHLADEFDCQTTKEPTDLWTGDMVYKSLQNEDASPLQDFFLFLADRANHVQQRVRPWLEDGELVITDRYADSTRAYQSHRIADQMDVPTVDAFWYMNDLFEPWNIEPDVVLYLDISVDTSVERCGAEDKYEKRENLTQVRQNYQDIEMMNGVMRSGTEWVTIDAEQSEDTVRRTAVAALNELL